MKNKTNKDPLITRSILKSELDARFSDFEDRFGRQIRKDFKEALKESFEEAKSYAGVQIEDFRHRIDTVIEGFDSHRVHLEGHEKRISSLETEIPLLKMAIVHRK